MKQKLIIIFLISSLSIFSGCYRYIYWAESVIDQGCKIETCYAMVQPYIRSAYVYDQFQTLALFDGLWLDDTVIQAYACAHAEKYGFTEAQYQAFLQDQRDENDPYISFYLLAVIYGNTGLLLNDENPLWVMQLRIGDNYYKPAKIKTVELEHEYRHFFGKRLTVFKMQYLVQFNAEDINEIPLINSMTPDIELFFRSVGHQASMRWCMKDIVREQTVPPLQDYTLAYDVNTNLRP